MRAPANKSISNLVIVVASAVVVFIAINILAQIRSLTQDVKSQTTINQKYLRCILLLPPEDFADREKRVVAIDRCAEESTLPSGERLGE